MKTVRFSQVVARTGPPAVHVSWLPPAKDPILQRALKEHRVMTVHQTLRGTRKDFGTVGLAPKGPAQILVFPKSLRRFADRKVVGIDYDVLPQPSDEPELSSAAHLEPQRDRGGKSRPSASLRSRADHPRPGSKSGFPRPARPEPRPATRTAAGNTPAAAKPPVRAPLRRSADPASREQLLVIIRRAVTDLKAGRTVPAYERLQAALAEEGK